MLLDYYTSNVNDSDMNKMRVRILGKENKIYIFLSWLVITAILNWPMLITSGRKSTLINQPNLPH